MKGEFTWVAVCAPCALQVPSETSTEPAAKRARVESETNEFSAGTPASENQQPNDSDDNAEGKKLFKRAEAKLRRMCEVKVSGRLSVDEDLHRRWMSKGKDRGDLIKMMVESGCEQERGVCSALESLGMSRNTHM